VSPDLEPAMTGGRRRRVSQRVWPLGSLGPFDMFDHRHKPGREHPPKNGPASTAGRWAGPGGQVSSRPLNLSFATCSNLPGESPPELTADLIGGFLIRHVEITGPFPAIEHARKVNVVIRDPQDVFDSYTSKLC
jgi:hypothetical protein